MNQICCTICSLREIGFVSHFLQYFPRNKCFPQFPRAPELETANISLRKARVRKSTCIGFLTFLHLRRKGIFILQDLVSDFDDFNFSDPKKSDFETSADDDGGEHGA